MAAAATAGGAAAFAEGARVEAHGLQDAANLNGLVGTVRGAKPPNRLLVDFGAPHGTKALRAANLRAARSPLRGRGETTYAPEWAAVEPDLRDVDYVDEKVEDTFKCGVCLSWLVDPVQCEEEHLICRGCVPENGRCPTCRDWFPATPKVIPKLVTRRIDEVQIRCRESDAGCEWTGPRGNLREHLRACPHAAHPCGVCGAAVRRRDRAGHYHCAACPGWCGAPAEHRHCDHAGCDVVLPSDELQATHAHCGGETCAFVGAPAEVGAHEGFCVHAALRLLYARVAALEHGAGGEEPAGDAVPLRARVSRLERENRELRAMLQTGFVVGGGVRMLRPVMFTSRRGVDAGAVGEVLQVPGDGCDCGKRECPKSRGPAKVRVNGIVFNLSPGDGTPVGGPNSPGGRMQGMQMMHGSLGGGGGGHPRGGDGYSGYGFRSGFFPPGMGSGGGGGGMQDSYRTEMVMGRRPPGMGPGMPGMGGGGGMGDSHPSARAMWGRSATASAAPPHPHPRWSPGGPVPNRGGGGDGGSAAAAAPAADEEQHR